MLEWIAIPLPGNLTDTKLSLSPALHDGSLLSEPLIHFTPKSEEVLLFACHFISVDC